ncbi:RtcB family protein [Pseudokineococcus lusitanus]|uniref:3'-phosphate/5'-hydroxy nucleic acid ligase n=1 Tax=Pseudokineococcus lusitanus TaxID=763993 RepID=A0A3N1GAP5_9ACTN|nr:RtcB family protein [Pseudokineococcus lusitanus]ROP27302.1 tRNA-splicing ligase RtcB [Pseudokineococcus lusitanus]
MPTDGRPDRLSPHLLSWASILDDATREQALTTATMPFVHPHVALMPDAHLGKGATVGSVIPTDGAIIPAAVGVDIGCGMLAVRTPYDVEALRRTDLRALHAGISRRVPLSAGGRNRGVEATAEPRVAELREMPGAEQADEVSRRWERQLGTLGSGNHFVEVSSDELGRVWLFLHSGSRGVGNQLAQRHIRVAQEQAARRFYDLPDRDLAYLVEGEPEFDAYVEALLWAQRFAALNREEMMDRVVAALAEALGLGGPEDVVREETIGCHHNYTARETHYGREVWLSRKGAISAREGELGLVPGSMGDASYVVVGRGDPVALHSSPHGAGRAWSRSAARKRFSRSDLDARMGDVVWGESDAFLDEHPEAYKAIDVVMADAARLVDVRHTLRQVVNVKGD